jgi:hypothetical protein
VTRRRRRGVDCRQYTLYPISGLPEIGSLGAHVGYSRHALGTHISETEVCGTMGPRLRGDDVAAKLNAKSDD